MVDDRTMAELLDGGPRSPDPGFRMDVLARVAERARRRAALRHALRVAGVFSAVGFAFPVMAATGIAVADLQSVLAAFAAMGLAFLAAMVSIAGPRTVWARSLSALRVSF